MKKGKFIVMAGCEGSGKSTQIDNLKTEYPDVVFSREPGGSEFGEAARTLILKGPGAKQASPFSQMGVAFAGCHDHFRNTVVPALESGRSVISDRSSVVCSLAYQVYGGQAFDLIKLFHMNRSKCLGVCSPDLNIILDISSHEGMKRVAGRENEKKGISNHFDDRGADFHDRVREGYLEFAKMFPENTVVIDAHPSREDVWKSIKAILDPILE